MAKSRESKENKEARDIYDALILLQEERGIPIDFMLDKIHKAIITACKNNYNGNEDAIMNVNKELGIFEVYLQKTVVDEISNAGKEISLSEARVIDPNVAIGEKVGIKLNTKDFGRIAAQTARNIIRQGIRDGEKDQIVKEFQSKQNEIVTATVEKIDQKNDAITLRIGRAEAVLPKSERITKEVFHEGDHVKVFVSDVKETEKGPKIIISRTHPGFVKKLFEIEVPEIQSNSVEIISVSREPGSRTKIAVKSNDESIDPVGACIGNKGIRIKEIIKELGGEKIDVIKFNDDIQTFISKSLSPAKVSKVMIKDEEEKSCLVCVPDNQLSLAIGNRGQNARLAARLTGWKIDIKPESFFKNNNFDQAKEEINENLEAKDNENDHNNQAEEANNKNLEAKDIENDYDIKAEETIDENLEAKDNENDYNNQAEKDSLGNELEEAVSNEQSNENNLNREVENLE